MQYIIEEHNEWYHLSDGPDPKRDHNGLAMVSYLRDVFEFWPDGARYIHRVKFEKEVMPNEYGLLQGFRYYQISEFTIVKNIRSEQRWDLGNPKEFADFIEYEKTTRSLFSAKRKFFTVMMNHAPTENIPSILEIMGVTTLNKARRYLSSSDVMKVVEHLEIRPEEVKENLPFPSVSGPTHFEMLANGQKGFASELSAFLVQYLLDHPDEINPSTRGRLILLYWLRGLDWTIFVSNNEPIVFQDEEILSLVRVKEIETLKSMILLPQVEIDGDVHRLIDRFVVYDDPNIAFAFVEKYSDEPDYLYRYQSSVLAMNRNTMSQFDVKALFEWQKTKASDDLKLVAKEGLYLVVVDRLENQEVGLNKLNASIVEASESGYVDIVKLLHEKGASLEAGGFFPIKFANLNKHKHVKAYLLSHGTPNKSFF